VRRPLGKVAAGVGAAKRAKWVARRPVIARRQLAGSTSGLTGEGASKTGTGATQHPTLGQRKAPTPLSSPLYVKCKCRV